MRDVPGHVEEPSTSVRTGINALNWSALGNATGSILRFVIGIVLARILGPEPFGQIAVALLATVLCNMLTEFGLSTVMIQRSHVSPEIIRGTFTLQVLIGLTLAVLWYGLAPVVTPYLHVEEATGAIRALALAIVFWALGQTSSALLRRQLRMKQFQLIQVSTYMASYAGLGLPLAWSGAGVWSLVVAQIAQSFLSSLLMYLSVRHPVSLGVAPLDGSLASGARIVGSGIVDWIVGNIDTLIVGRAFDPVSLGLYSRSYFSAFTPANVVISSLKSVLLSLLSRYQHNRSVIRQALLAMISVTAFLTVSVFGSLALVSDTFIEAIYGSAWDDAAPLLTPLALSMIPLILVSIISLTLWSVNEIKREFEYQALMAAMAIVVFLLAASISVIVVAWAVVAVYSVRLLFLSSLASLKIEIPRGHIAGALVRPLVAGLIISAIVFLVDRQLFTLELNAIGRLIADLTTGAAVVVMVLAMKPRAAIGSTGMWLYSRLPVTKAWTH